MKVKYALALALSHKAELLIMDEPTSGLDPLSRSQLLNVLRDYMEQGGKGVLFSTHITSDLDKIADYIAYLHEGRLQFVRPYDELQNNYGIINCGQQLFDALSREDIAAYRKEAYSYRVLITNRQKLRQVFQDISIENASIEDIMVFYVKGEKVK